MNYLCELFGVLRLSATMLGSAHARMASSKVGSGVLERDVVSNVVSFSAGVSAREKGERWQGAMALLSEMWNAKLESEVNQPRGGDQRVRQTPSSDTGLVCANINTEIRR